MNQKAAIPLLPLHKMNREDELKPLIGLPLSHIGRSGTSLQAHFGNLRQLRIVAPTEESVGEWMLEVYGDCPWRIFRPGQIVLASGDFNTSPLGDERDPYDGSASTRFDLMAHFLQKEIPAKTPTVNSIEMDGVEGFTMRFTGDYALVVFPADSEIEIAPRYWRVIQPATTEQGKTSGFYCNSLNR